MTAEQYDMIDRYFSHELGADELAALQQAVVTDLDFRTEFDLRRLVAAMHHRSKLLAFKQQTMQATPARSATVGAGEQSAKLGFLRSKLWAIAASVAILVVAIWWISGNLAAKENEHLFAQYDLQELYPSSDLALVNEGATHKGIIGSQEFNDLKIKGLQAFESKDWDTSIRLLEDYLSKAIPNEEDTPDEINLMNLFVGRAWLEKSEPQKAIASLQKADAGIVDTVNYALIRELIRWQLALAHLRNNDPKSALRMAESLRNAKHETIKAQANKMITDLK